MTLFLLQSVIQPHHPSDRPVLNEVEAILDTVKRRKKTIISCQMVGYGHEETPGNPSPT